MLESFVQDVVTTVLGKTSEIVEEQFWPRWKNAPAEWAAGYLLELTGEDMQDYILSCYEPNEELELQMMIAMDKYGDGDRKVADEVL